MFGRNRGDAQALQDLKAAGAVVSTQLVDEKWLGVGIADLIVLDADRAEEVRRPWTDVESAQWDGDHRVMTVRWISGEPPLRLRTAHDKVRDAVTALRERVTASQVHVEIMPTEAGGDVRAFVRRTPEGEMFTQLIARGSLTDEERERADELEARARAAVGLP